MWASDQGTYPGAWHESCSSAPLVPSSSQSQKIVRHWVKLLIFLTKQFFLTFEIVIEAESSRGSR